MEMTRVYLADRSRETFPIDQCRWSSDPLFPDLEAFNSETLQIGSDGMISAVTRSEYVIRSPSDRSLEIRVDKLGLTGREAYAKLVETAEEATGKKGLVIFVS